MRFVQDASPYIPVRVFRITHRKKRGQKSTREISFEKPEIDSIYIQVVVELKLISWHGAGLWAICWEFESRLESEFSYLNSKVIGECDSSLTSIYVLRDPTNERNFSIYLIFQAALGRGVYSASNRNEYQKQEYDFVWE
jgi:hypothetical protein